MITPVHGNPALMRLRLCQLELLVTHGDLTMWDCQLPKFLEGIWALNLYVLSVLFLHSMLCVFPLIAWQACTMFLSQSLDKTLATSANRHKKHPKTSVRGVIRTLIYNRMCILYWQGHANCNFISTRNLIKFLFPKCLEPEFWAILFWYMHALLINVFFFGAFSSKGFFVQLSTSSLKQVFLLDPPPMPLLRTCPNSSHIPWRNMWHLYSVNTKKLT